MSHVDLDAPEHELCSEAMARLRRELKEAILNRDLTAKANEFWKNESGRLEARVAELKAGLEELRRLAEASGYQALADAAAHILERPAPSEDDGSNAVPNGSKERFERAKAAWKEITGEDVSHLRWPGDACNTVSRTTGLGCMFKPGHPPPCFHGALRTNEAQSRCWCGLLRSEHVNRGCEPRPEPALPGLLFRVMSWDSGSSDCSDCTKRQVERYRWQHEKDCGHLDDLNAAYEALGRTDCVDSGYEPSPTGSTRVDIDPGAVVRHDPVTGRVSPSSGEKDR